MTVIVWEHFSQAGDRANEEVEAVTDIWRFSEYVDAADRHRISTDVNAYVAAVMNDEWPKMRHGESSAEAQRLVVSILSDIADMRVLTRRDSNLQNRLLDRAQVAADLRRSRINDVHSSIPNVLWIALIVGAVVVFGFFYLFGLSNFRVQLLMTAAAATLIGLSFAVVIALDFPFRGETSISPERWFSLHEIMAQGHQSTAEPQ
jgi:Protein of unknown function (DUF4239)